MFKPSNLSQKIHHDYILVIFTCVKYLHKTIKQTNTWIKNLKDTNPDIKIYHVLGCNEISTNYVVDVRRQTMNILYVKTPDDYISLPQKVIAAYTAIKDMHTFKYLFKTDDDQNLIKPNFFSSLIMSLNNQVIINNNSQIHYGGYFVNIGPNHISTYHTVHPELPPNLPLQQTTYCSGRFYLLSFEAVNYLISQTDNINKEYFEDYAIGYNLHLGYKNEGATMIFINTNTAFKDF